MTTLLRRGGLAGTAFAVAAVVAGVGACIEATAPGPMRAARPSRRAAERAEEATTSRSSLKEVVLPSGLRLLLDEDPHATTAGVVSVVAGGAAADPAGADGLGHLVEHLTFRAVDPVAGGEPAATRWDRLTRYAAGEVNGHTTRDCIMFYEFGPAARLDSLIALEGARLVDPVVGVDEEAFAVERQIVGSEHLLREDPRAGGWASHELLPLLFPPQHPYARSPGGTDESRRKLTLAQARAYASQNFRPERITLLVASPAGLTTLAAIAEKLPPALRGDASHRVARPGLGPAGAAATTLAAEAAKPAPAVAGHVDRRSSPLPTPELWLGWTLPGAVGDIGPTEGVLEHWVQEDVGSLQFLQEEPQILHVGAALQSGVKASILFVRVLTAEGADPDRVAQAVVARVASLWSREPAASESFAELKRLYETETLLDEPAQVSRAVDQAVLAALTERAWSMADAWTALRAVTSAAVAKLAYQHLTRENARALMFTPAPLAPDAARAAAPARGPAAVPAAREVVSGAGKWNTAELAGVVPAPAEVTTKTLPNGLTIVIARRPATAAVAWLGFRGGYADADPPLLVDLARRLRPDAQQATKLHILPGRGLTRDLSFDSVEFLPAQLPEALTLLFAKATSRVRDWPTRENLARMLSPLAAAEYGLATKADRDFGRALLGDHPYARVVSTRDLDRVTHSDIDAWLGRVHSVRNAALVVTGDVDPAEVERAATILSRQMNTPAWVADPPAPRAVTPQAGGAERVVPVVTARPGALTDIRLGCLLPPMSAADRGHYLLLKHAVEARLAAALRLDHGDSYAVDVALERLRGGTTFLVASTFVADEALGRSLAAIRSQWQRWARDGFDAGELNVARWRYAATVSFRYAGGHALAYLLLNEWNVEPAALGKERLFPDVAALRAGRVNELFGACKTSAVLGLTGNEALIQHALEQSWPAAARSRREAPP